MTMSAGAPGDEVPEAHWAEQEAEAGSATEDGGSPRVRVVSAGTREADEADLADQELSVDYGDDER
jgi:hypothetical protein